MEYVIIGTKGNYIYKSGQFEKIKKSKYKEIKNIEKERKLKKKLINKIFKQVNKTIRDIYSKRNEDIFIKIYDPDIRLDYVDKKSEVRKFYNLCSKINKKLNKKEKIKC